MVRLDRFTTVAVRRRTHSRLRLTLHRPVRFRVVSYDPASAVSRIGVALRNFLSWLVLTERMRGPASSPRSARRLEPSLETRKSGSVLIPSSRIVALITGEVRWAGMSGSGVGSSSGASAGWTGRGVDGEVGTVEADRFREMAKHLGTKGFECLAGGKAVRRK